MPQWLHTVSTLLLTIHKAAHLGQARSHFQQHSTLFNSLLFDLQSDIHSVHITKHLPFPYTMVFRLDNKKVCNDCNEMCFCSILASSFCTTTLDCVESFVASDIFISSSLFQLEQVTRQCFTHFLGSTLRCFSLRSFRPLYWLAQLQLYPFVSSPLKVSEMWTLP